MEDRLKFRAIINSVIQEVHYFYELPDNPHVVFVCTDFESGKGHFVPSSSLAQCTGMKDDKGDLIYEGDIVKIWRFAGNIHKTMVVGWRDTQCSFRLYDVEHMGATPQKLSGKLSLNCTDIRSLGAVTSIKIIGNIWENPELLERAE